MSNFFSIDHGIPQGSCVGPIAFLVYITNLYNILEDYKPTIYGYADDNQLYFSFPPTLQSSYATKLQIESAIGKAREFFLTHQLQVNDSKTEFLTRGTKTNVSKINISLNIGNSLVAPINSARNLGVIFDSHMSLKEHINQICKKSFFQLRRLRHLRSYMSEKTTTLLAHARHA